jgi:hypothetical protein
LLARSSSDSMRARIPLAAEIEMASIRFLHCELQARGQSIFFRKPL